MHGTWRTNRLWNLLFYRMCFFWLIYFTFGLNDIRMIRNEIWVFFGGSDMFFILLCFSFSLFLFAFHFHFPLFLFHHILFLISLSINFSPFSFPVFLFPGLFSLSSFPYFFFSIPFLVCFPYSVLRTFLD